MVLLKPSLHVLKEIMILLDDYIIDLKRVNQYGDESIVNDAPTTDLIRWINKYRRAVAKLTSWSWLVKSFSLTLVAGAQDIEVPTTIKKIIAINNGRGGYLLKVSIKQSLKWLTPTVGANDTNILGYFTDMGINETTGARIIRVFGKPGSAGTLTAYGTKAFADFALADIGTSKNFLPFSDEIMEQISELVSARISKFKNDQNWANYEKIAWDNLRIAMGEEQSDPSDDVTTSLPEYYLRRKAIRRNGGVC